MSTLPSALAAFDTGTALNYLERDGEILFTAEEIGKHLGYGNPKESIATLFSRHKSELKLYSRHINLIFGNDSSDIRVFTEEGVYILSMLARTNEAKKFRARVALLLRRVRQEAMRRQVELAREAARLESHAALENLSAQVIEARQRMLALETGMEQARREARAEGAKVALSLKPSDKTGMRKILAYRRRGLSLKETGKLMDLHQRKVGYLIKVARTMGLEA